MNIQKINNISPYLYVGYYCNNNCIFCSEADEYLEQLKEKPLSQIKQQLKTIRKYYDFVNIMGREPTIRPDILDIIKFAHALKFRQIGITTNGRLLSIKSFAKAILTSGVNQIGISLAGASANIHDQQTRVPGSFNQTMMGIKNILKYKTKDVSLLINLPLNRLNYQELNREMKLLIHLGIKEINILNISPLSRRSRTKKIIMPMHQLGVYTFKVLKDNGYLNRKNLRILLVEFPPCSLPKEARQYFFPCLEKNNQKIRIPLCTGCPYKNKCDGILFDYLKLYGSRNLKL
ncbi:MAG: radical SAM protein [Candidatus Aenigmatarchaeota archaeon]